jgi:nucleotide-binding universal stress UspA family protein
MSEHGAANPEDTSAITVVEERLSMPLHGTTRAHVEQAASDLLHRLIDDSAAKRCVGEMMVRTYPSIDEALGDEASLRRATLVIGRLARRGQERWVRLGRTARRVLRRLAGPVVVVPPDLRAKDVGSGPVVCAVDVRSETLSAVHLAEALARAIGRPLVLAHALPTLADVNAAWLSIAQVAEVGKEHEQRARAAFADFVHRHELGAHAAAILVGSPVDAVLDFAERERAAMIVCGSRLLGAAERVYTSSFGTELAAAAKIPVAVVPPRLELESV